MLLCLSLLLLIGVFALVLRSSLRSSGKGGFSVLFKLLISHLQVLGLVLSFDLQWPLEVVRLLHFSQRLASSPGAILSFDCFLHQDALPAPLTRFYLYLLLKWSLPLAGILLSSLC